MTRRRASAWAAPSCSWRCCSQGARPCRRRRAPRPFRAASPSGAGKTAVVRLRPRSYLELRAARIKSRLGELRDSLAAAGNPAAIRLYYAELIEADQELAGDAPVSLARFVGAVFGLARLRGGDPVEENRAALLALATFLGSGRFEAFVGPVRTAETKAYRPRARRVVLGGREDLRLHFLISAGLEIVSDTGVTYEVGEFKELLDARRGGSGFSFADLAADRAGVRFARQALDSDEAARRLQARLAGLAEEASFCSLSYVKIIS